MMIFSLFRLKEGIFFTISFINIFHCTNAQKFIAHVDHPVEQSVVFNDKLVFVTRQVLSGVHLWVSDGTSEGTYVLRNFDTDSYDDEPSEFVVYRGKLYFTAYTDLTQKGVWVTDGTIEGTKVVDIGLVECHDGPKPSLLTVFDNYLYFYDGSWCSESIWRTDGDVLEEVPLASQYNHLRELSVVGNQLFFYDFSGYPDRVSTIQANNSNLVEPFLPEITQFSYFTSTSQFLIFATSDTIQNQILQKYDVITDQWDTLGIFPRQSQFDNFRQIGDQLFFSVRNEEGYPPTDQLYVYSEVSQQAISLHTFKWSRSASNSFIQQFTVFREQLYFRSGEKDGYHLWTSDGTVAGTYKVLAERVVSGAPLIVSSDRLFFGSGNYGSSLWISDGTGEGSKPKSTINYNQSDNVSRLHNVNDTLFYFGDEGYGPALWKDVPAAQLVVKAIRGEKLHQATLHFPETKVDSLVTVETEILNIGTAPLYISGMEVIGKPFYLSDSLLNELEPGSKAQVLLSYFPSVKGAHEGKLILSSNDNSQSHFELTLKGQASGVRSANNPDSTLLPIEKSVAFYADPAITLDYNKIAENVSPGTTIGRFLNHQDDQSEYSVAFTKQEDSDNVFFEITENILTNKVSFDYEKKNTYLISVEVVDLNTQQSTTKKFVIGVTDESEVPLTPTCSRDEFPLSYALRDISWIDEEKFIAVGEYGTILKTENGGESWRTIATPYQENLRAVTMIGAVGYALSDKYLLKTEDEGESWFLLNFSSSANALFFLTANTGFVAGDQGMYRTTDGGKTWLKTAPGYEDYTDVYFKDESVGFICGGKSFLKTNNGGTTWADVDLELPIWHAKFIEIDFVDEQTGFLVATDGSLFRTTDGGQTWTLTTKVLISYAYGIWFVDRLTGYMYGNSSVYLTRDGGIQWEKLPVNKQAHSGLYTILSMAFNPSASTGCMVGRADISFGVREDGRVIIKYDNSSANWTMTSYQQDSQLHKVSFLDDNVGFALGENIYQTLDGGIQWLPLEQPDPQRGNFSRWRDGHFFTLDQFIIIDEHVAYMTNDGGDSWDTLFQSQQWLNEVYFINDQEGFVTGWDGIYFRTSDGGKTWSQMKLESDLYLSNLQFLNEKIGYMTTRNRILKTNDGGQTWSDYTFEKINLINSLHYLDEKVAVLSSNDSKLYYTNDGGVNWLRGKSQSWFDVTKLQLVSPTMGYACTDNNELLVTRDGGKIWTRNYNLVNSANSFYVKDETVYVVGKNNYLSRVGKSVTSAQPGYIYGSDQVAVGEKTIYSLKTPHLNTYRWTVSGDNKLIFRNHEAIVEWQQAGIHTIQVQAIDGCGISMSRDYTVRVDAAVQPTIIGTDSVTLFAKNIPYTVDVKNNNPKIWVLQGHVNSRFANDTLWVDWGDEGIGIVEVVETNLKNQVRGKALLNIIIQSSPGSVTSSQQSSTDQEFMVYPNPTQGMATIDLPTTDGTIGILNLKVVNLNGTVFLEESIQINPRKASLIVDTSLWQIGVYVVNITLPSGIKRSQRMIKVE